jgi:hypothetical protein
MVTNQMQANRRSSPRTDQQWPDMAAVRSSMTDIEQRARTRIMERPIVAVLVALGSGYVVARLVSRGIG